MSWRRIKTFLIVLFAIINVYLIFSSPSDLFFKSKTNLSKDVISDTSHILEKNYGIIVESGIIPESVENLNNIDAMNIIYSSHFGELDYFSASGSEFFGEITTDIYAYNEQNALSDILKILDDMNIAMDSYVLSFYKNDEGLWCVVDEYVGDYPLFNGRIKALFTPGNIKLSGSWYLFHDSPIKLNDTSLRMTDVTSVLIDFADLTCSPSDASPKTIEEIGYGYYVSYYDENTVAKSATAVPCYMIETGNGSKYYYDAINGFLLKQEV